MQFKATKPLVRSVSFWGLLLTIALIFLFMVIRSNGILDVLILGTLGFIFFPYIVAIIILATMFITFGIIFTVYLSRRIGDTILAKRQINKTILYTALVLGIVIVLGIILYLVVNIPIYLYE